MGQSKIERVLELFNLDIGKIKSEISRAVLNADKDPDDLITSAENIIVATCKKILSEQNIQYGKTDSPQQLLYKVFEQIELLPE